MYGTVESAPAGNAAGLDTLYLHSTGRRAAAVPRNPAPAVHRDLCFSDLEVRSSL